MSDLSLIITIAIAVLAGWVVGWAHGRRDE